MTKELKILMLEDVEEDAGLFDRVLTKEKIVFTRLRVDTRKEFIESLETYNPDVILSDHALPQFNSIEALKIVQERNGDVPFIIVTGSVSEEFAVSCIKKGADDYVLKSNLSRLPLAINHALNERLNRKIRLEQGEMLRKQNDELLKFNKELDSFVYNISHHLRSPLSSVLGVVNVARLDHKNNPDTYLDMIQKSTLRLDETLGEISNYSQNLRTDLEISEIDFRMLCDIVFKRFEFNNSIKIEKQFDIRSEAAFYSDNYRLSLIMSYIISNSIKYMDVQKNNPFIRISASISQTQAFLSILDNGVGIFPEHLPKVFDMFVRTNLSSNGAGLGLFVVKEIVEKLKGTIEINSSHGEWTRVDITLPNYEPAD
jgi:signal transduction histidine kinase